MKKMIKIDWKKGYPIKKICLCVFWFVILLAVLGGIQTFFSGNYQREDIVFTIGFGILEVVTIVPLVKYVCKRNQSVPYLNGLLTTAELKSLFIEEQLERIEEFRGTVWYKKITEGPHWYCVNGSYVSKDLAIMCSLVEHRAAVNGRASAYLEVLYITGESVEVDTGLGVLGPLRNTFYSYIKASSDLVIVNFGIDAKIFGPSFQKILNEIPYKSMDIMGVMGHAHDIKSRCRATFSQETLKVHNSIEAKITR